MSIADKSKVEILEKLRIAQTQIGLVEIREHALLAALRLARNFISELETQPFYVSEAQDVLHVVQMVIKKSEEQTGNE